jgi:hypothetical protein
MKSGEFSHFILTRFNTQDVKGMLYDKPNADEWMEERMELFERTKESVLNQAGDFRWVISLDKRTPKKFRNKIITDGIIEVNCDIRNAFNEIEVKTPWVITSRIDNDDYYKPGFVKAVQREFRPEIMVIDVGVLRLEETEERSEIEGPRSMFISLVEPSHRIITAFCRPHGRLFKGYPLDGHWATGWGRLVNINYAIVPKNLAVMVVHSNNVANT